MCRPAVHTTAIPAEVIGSILPEHQLELYGRLFGYMDADGSGGLVASEMKRWASAMAADPAFKEFSERPRRRR